MGRVARLTRSDNNFARHFFKRKVQSGNKKNFLAYSFIRDVVAVLRIKTILSQKTFHLHDKYFYANIIN